MLWRAFFIFGAMLTASGRAAVPSGPLPELAQVGKPNAQQAAQLIEQFRTAGIPGDYYLEFELRALPRRGEGKTFKGRWWGSRNDEGLVTRIELTDGAGAAHRLLLQNGERAKVWRWSNDRVVDVGIEDLLAPLIPGVEVSAFDLQMPYLYWPGATVDKITRVLGRPSNQFLFPAPPAFRAQHAQISGVRAYFDTALNAPLQVEMLGRDGRVAKTLALLSLQTVEKQTLPKAVDYRNEVTRDKTRLQFTGAALNLDWPAELFQSASLAKPASPPAAERVVRIAP